MFYLARKMKDSPNNNIGKTTTESNIDNEPDPTTDKGYESNNIDPTTVKASSSEAVSTIPKLLVAMNLAFSLARGKKDHNNSMDDDVDIATDASVKHCKTNGRRSSSTDETVPTTIVTLNSTLQQQQQHPQSHRRKDDVGEITFDDSYDDGSEVDKYEDLSSIPQISVSRKINNHKTTAVTTSKEVVKMKIQDLRQDMRNVQPSGLVGNVLFWWIHPVKWVSDPVFGVAESIIPAITSTVPFSETVMGLGLDATTTMAHCAYGMTRRFGVMTTTTTTDDQKEEESRARILTQLLSLVDLSRDTKDKFIKAVYAQAGKQRFLLGMDKDLYFSLTMEQDAGIEMWIKGFGGLYEYGKEVSLGRHVEKVGGMLRYVENKAVLGVLQQADLNMMGQRRYDEMLVTGSSVGTVVKEILAMFPLDDAHRYVKFAVAAYGDNGITSANLELHQSIDLRAGDLTRTRISEYTGIPCDDIEVMGVDYGTEPNHLSHFVALDHFHKKIVLAIRGTHTPTSSESLEGNTKTFLEGRAHKVIAVMAENLWKNVGYSVIRLLHENPWYELVVTGHSLGAGVTVLLNMLLHKDERIRGHNFRCYAFGSPPVFKPLSAIPNYVAETCVCYINQFDKVPFTSAATVLHQADMIQSVERMDLDLMQRARLVLGMDTPHAKLVHEIHSMQREWRLSDEKANRLGCPCAGVLWMVEQDDNDASQRKDQYEVVVADPAKVASGGLMVHRNDFRDHLPARYEHVLSHVSGR